MCEKIQNEAEFVNYLLFLSIDTVFRISCHTGSSENRTKLSCVSPSLNWRRRPNLLCGHPVFGTQNKFMSRAPSEAYEW